MSTPNCEATKVGNIPPPINTPEYEKWRKSVDPDTMGFNGQEVQSEPNS